MMPFELSVNTHPSKKWLIVKYISPIILGVLVILIGIVAMYAGPKPQMLVLVIVFGIPFVVLAFLNLKAGVVIAIVLSYFLLGTKRIIGDVPLGLALDGLIFLMFFSLLAQLVYKGGWNFAGNRISFAILIWIIYNLMEAINPSAASVEAWAYTVRSMAGLMVLYFIVLYALDTLKYTKFLIKLWLVLCTLAAIHGLNQEYFGFLPFEHQWVYSDPERFALLFQMGRFRKFSFLSDAMIFGFVMAYTAVLCFVLAGGPVKPYQRIMLLVAGGMMTLSMVYSGTRAAYVLLPVGGIFYTIITLKRNIIIFSIVGLIFGAIFINIPTGNVNIIRIQSAFKPGEDASYNTRKRNQKMIQPFLWSHPMGGGMGSTGDWGERFSPGSFLSKFPPDSGYMRIVVEMGPIGLAIYLFLLFTVLMEGVKNYFAMNDPKLKNLLLGILCVTFALLVANFPQEATGQIPTSLWLYVMFAIICKIKDFDGKS
jgi:putative inorganic carbon (hco3(-)) transporter